MKAGDLVRLSSSKDPRLQDLLGFVMRVDSQHYGSNTAYKISKVDRGKAIRPNMVDFIGVTADGIQDRVLILWECSEWEYVKSNEIEVFSE